MRKQLHPGNKYDLNRWLCTAEVPFLLDWIIIEHPAIERSNVRRREKLSLSNKLSQIRKYFFEIHCQWHTLIETRSCQLMWIRLSNVFSLSESGANDGSDCLGLVNVKPIWFKHALNLLCDNGLKIFIFQQIRIALIFHSQSNWFQVIIRRYVHIYSCATRSGTCISVYSAEFVNIRDIFN